MALPNRILYICHDGDLYGSQQSLSLIVKNLPRETYRCFVSIARPGPLQDLLAAEPHVTVLKHKRLQWVKHDPRNWFQQAGDVLTLLITALPRVFRLYHFIKRHKIDIVHTNSVVSLEGALAAALAGVPHVWHIREMFMEKSPKFHMVLGRTLSRRMIDRFSDEIICISTAVRNQFGPYLENDGDYYHLIHNALALENDDPLPPWNDPQRAIMKALSLQALKLPEGRFFRIGYIGRLSEGKGFHELLAAFAQLKRRDLPVALVVAGHFVDEPYERRIRSEIEAQDLQESVHFLGYQQDLGPVYELLDVLVVPSRNEPFGRVVIEAMAHGVPCIGTDAGGIPEIIESGETGLLYPPGDIFALTGMIEELMAAFWKLDLLRQNARRMVCQRFNIETQIGKLDACYQSLIRQHQLL